jgi:hypothetical protein
VRLEGCKGVFRQDELWDAGSLDEGFSEKVVG